MPGWLNDNSRFDYWRYFFDLHPIDPNQRRNRCLFSDVSGQPGWSGKPVRWTVFRRTCHRPIDFNWPVGSGPALFCLLTAGQQGHKRRDVKQIDEVVAVDVGFGLKTAAGYQIDKRTHIEQAAMEESLVFAGIAILTAYDSQLSCMSKSQNSVRLSIELYVDEK